MVLSPVCLRLFSLHVGVGCWVGVGRLLGLLKWSWLPLSPFVSLHVGLGVGWCGSLPGLSKWLSPVVPVVSLHVGWVLVGVVMWDGCWLV